MYFHLNSVGQAVPGIIGNTQTRDDLQCIRFGDEQRQ